MRALDFLSGVRIRAGSTPAPLRAPRRRLSTLVGRGPLFVLAPHPDDESIGCGGLIAACAKARVPVFVHILTDGRHSHPGSAQWPPERIAQRREEEARRAGAHLGLSEDALRFERAIDGSLLFDWSGANTIAARVAAAARDWERPVIAAPWRGDPHPDHMAAAVIADLTKALCPNARGLSYFVWSHAMSLPASAELHRFPINRHRRQKRRAIYAHQTQRGLIDDCDARTALPDLTAALGDDEFYLTTD